MCLCVARLCQQCVQASPQPPSHPGDQTLAAGKAASERAAGIAWTIGDGSLVKTRPVPPVCDQVLREEPPFRPPNVVK